MNASGAISITRFSRNRVTRSLIHDIKQGIVKGAKVGIDLVLKVAGKEAQFLSASTAGRARTIRLTCLVMRNWTAMAAARYVLPVPAGPMPNTMSCCSMASR
jgi:hypothetical protein